MKIATIKTTHLVWYALGLLFILRAVFPDFFQGIGDGFMDGMRG